MESEYRKIGRRIHALRAKKGIFQGSMAKKMGLSQTSLCNIENGKTVATLKNLFKMQEILGCRMREFFEDGSEEAFNIEEILEGVQLVKKMKSENKGEVCWNENQ